MGHEAPSKPSLARDKVMSDRHKGNRAAVEVIKNPESKLKASIKYNMEHATEHIHALKESANELSSRLKQGLKRAAVR